jgi:hypothetical protein
VAAVAGASLGREQAVTRQRPAGRAGARARALVLRGTGREADGRVQASRYLSPRLRMAAEPASARQVTFLPEGMSSGARFRIDAPGRRVFLVTVDALTGRVRTEQGGS